ncbi:MAG: DMT family protein [Sphingomicrobium sp.]
MITIAFLTISNIFMTIAWYGQLRFPNWSIPTAILVGWSIALLEYCFAVPANRIGYFHGFTGGQLKIIQEVITLTVFAIFAAAVLKEPLGWRYLGAFACIVGAATFMFAGRA